MADLSNVPQLGYPIERIPGQTLRTDMEDGSNLVREKSPTVKRVFRPTFKEPTAAMKTFLDFVATKGLDTSFSWLTRDPKAADPDTDEATVKFLDFPNTTEPFNGVLLAACVMRED